MNRCAAAPQVNMKTQTGSTPLHNAASNGHDGCVAALLAAACAVNSRRRRRASLDVSRPKP